MSVQSSPRAYLCVGAVRETLEQARRRRADHHRACGALAGLRPDRSTRTLGLHGSKGVCSMPRVVASALAIAVFLVGCTEKAAGPAQLQSNGQANPYGLAAAQMAQPSESADENRQYLERKHTVTLDVPENQIASAFEAIVAACENDRESHCTLLDSELTKAEYTTASITARIAPTSVEHFIAAAAKHGSVESRLTHTNDLAKPIIDTDQRLKMLETYMADLLRLQQQSKRDVDALIKVTSEIAKTQSEIASLKGEYAQLRQRVDLQIVSLQLYSNRTRSLGAPIARASREFGRDLTSGIAQAITGLAYLIPWLFILLPLAFLFRYLWKRLR